MSKAKLTVDEMTHVAWWRNALAIAAVLAGCALFYFWTASVDQDAPLTLGILGKAFVGGMAPFVAIFYIGLPLVNLTGKFHLWLLKRKRARKARG